ncbi:Universal stress protein family protein [Vibrio mediterranei]|uniref:universal stress protein n=1 Tax=Vibrio mediterranei TaxID=689 RepID=UPI0007838554|nr:universal stress protein [Vibrio mediterranei]SBO09160.1 Universal stress protein family protein [Vibrio mediterranei]
MSNPVIYALNLHSPQSLKRAASIARRFEGPFYVCYVTDLEEELEDDTEYFGEVDAQAYVNKKHSELKAKIHAMIDKASLQCEDVYILNGPIALTINELAEKVSAQLIIVSKTHHKYLKWADHQRDIESRSHCDVYVMNVEA